jgi:hypothetical protein
MRGKMREGSAAKAEAPQKIDDDQAEQPSMSDAAPPPPISMWGGHTADQWTPSTPRWRGHPFMQALLRRSLFTDG